MRSMFGHLLAALVFLAAQSRADFTNAFDGITSGSGVALTWDAVQPQYYPLCITAQVIDKNGDGFSANAYRVNITTDASGTSYLWTGAPFPLRWLPGGLYQLELRPTSWTGSDAAPLLAQSPFFSISDPGKAAQGTGSAGQSTPADSQSGDGPGISKPVAIGLGVAIGVPSVVAGVIVGWCVRKRQRRAAMEKRRLKRSEFVIS
ncbi:hypothetical protein C8A01DRAFT_21333 [Parachaetomium inaequale]|uniref:Uncharacterized protein n=1 Tax=Parachaetomium inaequale TaxID=2588326 RepID=A0AAN6SK84_9PEZI|nr:hypothetical protein C8A01DRAFT_21333 [Parachaetomium inaequale]